MVTVTVKVVPVLIHPLAFFTVMVPVYVPATVLAGTEIVMGLEGKAAFTTATKLLEGEALHVILYVVGNPVVAL
jgi:hypothetical protein